MSLLNFTPKGQSHVLSQSVAAWQTVFAEKCPDSSLPDVFYRARQGHDDAVLAAAPSDHLAIRLLPHTACDRAIYVELDCQSHFRGSQIL